MLFQCSINYLVSAMEKRFYVVEQFSIQSNRLMGKEVQSKLASGNVQDALKKASRSSNHSQTNIVAESSTSPSDSLEDGDELKLPLRFGEAGLGDKFATQWDWPYSNKPIVTNTFNDFEVIIDFTPFAADEIWVRKLFKKFDR